MAGTYQKFDDLRSEQKKLEAKVAAPKGRPRPEILWREQAKNKRRVKKIEADISI